MLSAFQDLPLPARTFVLTFTPMAAMAVAGFSSPAQLLIAVAAAAVAASLVAVIVSRPVAAVNRFLETTHVEGDYTRRMDRAEDRDGARLAEGIHILLETITDREARLRDAEHRAQNAARSKDSFLANMSHEIRTPMTGVLGLTDELRRSELDEHQRELVDTVHSCAQSLLTMMSGVLEYSRIEQGDEALNPAPTRIVDLLSDTIELFRAEAELKDIDLSYSIGRRVPSAIVADPLRLRQALTNLVGNGVKFTESGRVTARIDAVDPDNDRDDDGETTQATLRFAVEDTGIGIDEHAIDHIFGEFSQADDSTTRSYGGDRARADPGEAHRRAARRAHGGQEPDRSRQHVQLPATRGHRRPHAGAAARASHRRAPLRRRRPVERERPPRVDRRRQPGEPARRAHAAPAHGCVAGRRVRQRKAGGRHRRQRRLRHDLHGLPDAGHGRLRRDPRDHRRARREPSAPSSR